MVSGFLAKGFAAFMMVLLTTTQAEACTKRNQIAKVALKQHHPCQLLIHPEAPARAT